MKFIDSEILYNRFIDRNSTLVKIHDNIDFAFVNPLCEGKYSDDGQNPYLPEYVYRVSFIQFFKGGLSDNEVVKQCKTNFEYRYFCNLAVDDELFDDCKLSRFRKEIGPEKFKEIFDMLVENIKMAGFISNKDAQYMDSFLFLADIKLVSTNALLSKAIIYAQKALNIVDNVMKKDTSVRDFELSDDEQKNRFVMLVKKAQDLLAEYKDCQELSSEAKKCVSVLAKIVKERAEISEDSIRKKDCSEEQDRTISVSDPDARMMGKAKDKILPSFKSHVMMNEAGFITYTDATLSTVYDGHHAAIAVKDVKKRGFTVPTIVGDNHYGDILFRQNMALENTYVVAPYKQNQVLNSCLSIDVMIEAWAYNHTEEYRKHRRIRAHIEPKQGEMKNLHGMKRAKLRGLDNIRIQNYMSAIVTNCKHFAKCM